MLVLIHAASNLVFATLEWTLRGCVETRPIQGYFGSTCSLGQISTRNVNMRITS